MKLQRQRKTLQQKQNWALLKPLKVFSPCQWAYVVVPATIILSLWLKKKTQTNQSILTDRPWYLGLKPGLFGSGAPTIFSSAHFLLIRLLPFSSIKPCIIFLQIKFSWYLLKVGVSGWRLYRCVLGSHLILIITDFGTCFPWVLLFPSVRGLLVLTFQHPHMWWKPTLLSQSSLFGQRLVFVPLINKMEQPCSLV